MQNYQLYSTNILLGGNMKFDFVLGATKVDKIQITPLSDKVPYNYTVNDNIKNQSLIYNIRKFYKDTCGYFYDDCVDEVLQSDWPIVSNTEKVIDDTFMMGCKEVTNKYHGKQFEMFVPMWLGSNPKNIKVTLEINVDDKPIWSNDVCVYDNKSDASLYLKDYFAAIQEIPLDNLLNIDFEHQLANVCGLSVETGQVVTVDMTKLLNILTECERPMMEVDSLLCRAFSDNKLIARNLFNVNLCFNLDDIITGTQIYIDKNLEYTISAHVKIDDKYITPVDFYTNYKNIDREYISMNGGPLQGHTNILEENDKYIELKNKNKIVQKYFHWSLVDYPTYLFNLHSDCSGVFNVGNGDVFCDGYSGISGDLLNSNSFIPWASVYDYKTDTNDREFTSKYSDLVLKANTQQIPFIYEFTSGIKYKPDVDDSLKKLRLAIVLFNEQSAKNGADPSYQIFKDGELLFKFNIYNDNTAIIFTTDLNNVTFKAVRDWLNEDIKDEDRDLRIPFRNLMNSYVQPSVITINQKIVPKLAEGPSKDCREIEYYKANINMKLMRYVGNLMPYFIGIETDSAKNILYYKKKISEFKGQYLQYKYKPLYESIEFYSYGVLTDIYSTRKFGLSKWYNKSKIKIWR